MKRVARVRRVLTAEYDVPVEDYVEDGAQMTDEDIEAWEMEEADDPSLTLDNVVNEIVTVEFVEVSDDEVQS